MNADVARGLLTRARDDAEAVRATLSIGAVTDAIVGFHAQQAVEKSLKAVLADGGIGFPFTHDLEGLIERCGSHAIAVPELLVDSAGQRTPYAVHHRYGGAPPALVDREAALLLAEAAVAWAGSTVKGS